MSRNVKHSSRSQSLTGRGLQTTDPLAHGSAPRSGKTGRAHNSDSRVWGKRAPGNSRGHPTTTQRITELFEEQRKLTARVARQAKLLKVAESEVFSTETEHLRRVNEEILHRSAELGRKYDPSKEYNRTAFSRTFISDAQKISENMILRQGERFEALSLEEPVPPAQVFKLRSRTRQYCMTKGHTVPPSQLFKLEGPLLRHYLKAVSRGYLGGPATWLRSRYARDASRPLIKKGVLLPPCRGWSIFDRASPLHWCVTAHTSVKSNVTTGFRGEMLRRNMNFMTMQSQRRAVAKLPKRSWPTDPRDGRPLWPSYPTISESWESYLRNREIPDSTLRVTYLTGKVTLRQVRDNSELAYRIVRHNICGVRADVLVPAKWLVYFKYRWGFLILTKTRKIPIGLTRFLLSLWKRNRLQLLQFKAVPLRTFLSWCVPSRFITETAHKCPASQLVIATPEDKGVGQPPTVVSIRLTYGGLLGTDSNQMASVDTSSRRS
jgi:hypothetical protein